jgi:hypothetical protein
MPSFGGFGGVFPLRFGGAKPPLQHRLNAVLAQLGSLYSNDTTGLVWLRAMALARVLNDAWESNRRLSYQWDPLRMTDFLGRWEAIFTLPVSPSDSLSTRRARVALRMSLAGYIRAGDLYTMCLSYLGSSVFIGIANQSSSSANVWTPAGWPMGSHPVAATDPDWYSSVAHVVILTQTPAAMAESDWRTLISTLKPALDLALPAWVTFDIIRDGAGGAIFKLDDAHNLDFERLS